jgi:hypothetical protein
MGTIYYGGSATPIHIDDRALAHLKVVVATKLRRGESFTVSWTHPDDQPRGRTTIWLHPSIPLRFVLDEPDSEPLSREWIESLASSANSSGGISLVAENIENEADSTPDIAPQAVELIDDSKSEDDSENAEAGKKADDSKGEDDSAG